MGRVERREGAELGYVGVDVLVDGVHRGSRHLIPGGPVPLVDRQGSLLLRGEAEAGVRDVEEGPSVATVPRRDVHVDPDAAEPGRHAYGRRGRTFNVKDAAACNKRPAAGADAHVLQLCSLR